MMIKNIGGNIIPIEPGYWLSHSGELLAHTSSWFLDWVYVFIIENLNKMFWQWMGLSKNRIY